jgi:hypothetical protein
MLAPIPNLANPRILVLPQFGYVLILAPTPKLAEFPNAMTPAAALCHTAIQGKSSDADGGSYVLITGQIPTAAFGSSKAIYLPNSF